MKKKHLHLVVSNNVCCVRKPLYISFFQGFENFFKVLFVSKREKIYILKDFLIKIYRDYEITTGINDVPYYIKAENKINKIIRENKVNYYFKLYENFKRNHPSNEFFQ